MPPSHSRPGGPNIVFLFFVKRGTMSEDERLLIVRAMVNHPSHWLEHSTETFGMTYFKNPPNVELLVVSSSAAQRRLIKYDALLMLYIIWITKVMFTDGASCLIQTHSVLCSGEKHISWSSRFSILPKQLSLSDVCFLLYSFKTCWHVYWITRV